MKRIVSLCAVAALCAGTAFADTPLADTPLADTPAVNKDVKKSAPVKSESAPAAPAPKADAAVDAKKGDQKADAGKPVEVKATTSETAKTEKK